MSSRVAASPTASLMAEPREPGDSGSATGEGTTWPPHVSIIIRRYGFWLNDDRTM